MHDRIITKSHHIARPAHIISLQCDAMIKAALVSSQEITQHIISTSLMLKWMHMCILIKAPLLIPSQGCSIAECTNIEHFSNAKTKQTQLIFCFRTTYSIKMCTHIAYTHFTHMHMHTHMLHTHQMYNILHILICNIP